MSYLQMAAIMSPTVKFGAAMNSRISKPPIQTIFENVDVITPRLKALKAVVSPTEQIMRALKPVNPLALATGGL